MLKTHPVCFQDFFGQEEYLSLKNHLYNYRLRMQAVRECFKGERTGIILEVGSGISPVMTSANRICYTDISCQAVKVLKKTLPRGLFVVADCMHLPFKPGAFTHAIASEVLEHLENDSRALRELSGVLTNKGRLVITFPHKKSYFSLDDSLVGHHRRYELGDMKSLLERESFRILLRKKVLGPLEKCIMIPMTLIYHLSKRSCPGVGKAYPLLQILPVVSLFRVLNTLLMAVTWLDARVVPLSLSAVILIKAEKI